MGKGVPCSLFVMKKEIFEDDFLDGTFTVEILMKLGSVVGISIIIRYFLSSILQTQIPRQAVMKRLPRPSSSLCIGYKEARQ